MSTDMIIKINTDGDKKNIFDGARDVLFCTKPSEGNKIFPKLPVLYASFLFFSFKIRIIAEIAPSKITAAIRVEMAIVTYGSRRFPNIAV